ncbi:four helix bundle protein [Candidatus Bipolaricaulota bacterium]|nr:four helix bundle protein [Candidatus Bipolaricaulota bacterium]
MARELVSIIYTLTKKPGFDDDRNLRDQIRRAAVSIVVNIAESRSLKQNRFPKLCLGSSGI